MSIDKPIIGIPACRKQITPHMFHAVGEKYISAVAIAAGGVPLLIPALGGGLATAELLQTLDGLLFTGSPSNVEPHHYQGDTSEEGTLHDPHRDASTLPLMAAAIDAGLPVFAICRGCQERRLPRSSAWWQRACCACSNAVACSRVRRRTRWRAGATIQDSPSMPASG